MSPKARFTFVLLSCIALLASPLVAQTESGGGPELVSSGDTPVLRYAVAHEHYSSYCVGYLYLSNDTVRYEVVSPDQDKGHGFDLPHSQLQTVSQWTPWDGARNAAEFKFTGSAKYRFIHLRASVVARGKPFKSQLQLEDEGLPYQQLIDAATKFDEVLAEAKAREERLKSPPAAVAEAKSAPQVAQLNVVTQPGNVQVYLDEKFKGITSEQEGTLEIENLALGSHRLRLTLPGYKEFKQNLTLTAGETLPITAKLEPAGPKPLAFEEVEDALKNGVPKKRVLALVQQFGVDFAMTPELENRLREAGADFEVLYAISQTKK